MAFLGLVCVQLQKLSGIIYEVPLLLLPPSLPTKAEILTVHDSFEPEAGSLKAFKLQNQISNPVFLF